MLPLMLACVHPTPPGPSPLEQLADLNGVVLQPTDGSQLVYLQATIQAGSAYDPIGQEGIAWLTAESMRQGGAGDRTSEEVDQLLYELAADIDVVVDKELVTFRGKALASDRDTFVPLFVDMVASPAFEETTVERLRAQALDHLTVGILDSNEALGDATFDTLVNEGHPYGHPIEGRSGVVGLLDVDAVQAFHADAYVRTRVTLGLAGDVDQALADQIDAALALDTVDGPEATPKPRLDTEGRTLLVVERETEKSVVNFGHELDVDRGHPDYPALFLAMIAFGDHRESHGRLYSTLRGDRGLNYGDYAYIEHYVQKSGSSTQEVGTTRAQPQFMVWLRPLTQDTTAWSVKAAVEMTEDLVATGLDPAEFELIQEYLLQRMRIWAQDPGRRLEYAVEAQALGYPNQLEDLPDSIEALTVEQVNAALTRHIRPADLRIVVVAGNSDELIRELTEEKSTPLVKEGLNLDDEQEAWNQEVAESQLGLQSWSIVPAEGIFQ
ncbi:MAG: insulinase family protein [Proteobacteria bacterium]|nr:insulinase family protein [Pseudomonadota bacterium]MCP4919889.1 insulinase family protein [Pseudomonadota bacterium]